MADPLNQPGPKPAGQVTTSAISVGQYDAPDDGSSVIDGITLCCASLARDNSIIDCTNGIANLGKHTGSAFTDGSSSYTSFNSYGGADIGFRHAGNSAVGLKLEGTYRFFQVQGVGWSVNESGNIATAGETVSGNSTVTGTATVGAGLTVTAGAIKPAQYTVASLFACLAASKGSIAVVTDLARAPQYREVGVPGGGTISSPMFCNGSAWEAH
ncbi:MULTISPECIES: hypothetical protein [Methylorubrum]|uniref:hypothetical protein n=1 Tax=Methylorubrum TaxID=2282523 RepID=UPI00209C7B45|nr:MULTISPECIES: hypothetical protein [Methylorubrum]MCP1550454.1 hypothetical protein [Methylorubrum zatmanii]MCP1552933.1 hypothetical protein [Methylorubrum extorquens]MCP1580757.1 hypothetical protein [Methylorubrum extorquens]